MNEEARESTLTWHRITGEQGQQLPDGEIAVLVYDEDLDYVVHATLEFDDDDIPFWLDLATDQRLPNPTWWADVPYPEEA